MMKETMTDTQTDWRYSDERMKYREAALRVLLRKFGHQLENGGSPRILTAVNL